MDENPANDEEDEEVLAAVAHFIMVHYKEKEGIKKKKKKKYKPKAGQYQLEVGIKRLGERGEPAVNIFWGGGRPTFSEAQKTPKKQTDAKQREALFSPR